MRSPSTTEIETTILALLDHRGDGKTICPSEAARAIAGDDAFRAYMGDVRRVAAAMAQRGQVEATQGGEVVDAIAARGPIRLRLAQRSTSSR